MKKILLILGFVSQLVAGCSDFFDTAPSNKIPTTMAFRTVTDVDNAVNGLYDLMSGSGYYGAAMFAYGDMKGDDMQSSEESGVCNTCYMFNHRPNSLNAGSLWGRPFYILREAWNILNAIAEGKIESGDEKKLNALKGETMAVIALCQFDLTRCFGYPYTKDKGASLGAPLIDHLVGTYENPPRSTVAQAYDFIIETLEEAVTLMSEEKNNGRMNKYAARALLARIYLYHDDNRKAFDLADQLIKDADTSGSYALYPHTGTIDGCSRSIFQYRKRFNIFWVHQRKPIRHTLDTVVIDGQPVNYNQRIIAGIQGRASTDTDLCTSTRSTVIGNHTHTSYLSSQHILCIGSNTLTQFIWLDGSHRTGSVIFLHRAITNHHHIIQHFRIILKCHIHCSCRRKLLSFITDKGNDNHISLFCFQCKITIKIRNGSVRCSFHQNICSNHAHSGIIFHYTFHGKSLCKNLHGK